MAVDPETYNAYFTNGVDDSVSVIDGSTRTVTATGLAAKVAHASRDVAG